MTSSKIKNFETISIYSRCKTFEIIKLSFEAKYFNILNSSAVFELHLNENCMSELEKNGITFVTREAEKSPCFII